MRDSWAPGDETWAELVESMGWPILCTRCRAKGQQTVVAFLSDVDGRKAVTPAIRFKPEDRDWPRTEMPSDTPPLVSGSIGLRCWRCEKGCGDWSVAALVSRAMQGKPWVPAD
jgi:hypothetical protein